VRDLHDAISQIENIVMEALFTEETPEEQVNEHELTKGEVLSELLDRFTNADAYRRQYDQIATRCYKLYRAYQREAKRGRSNLHIPRVYEQIDTLRSRIVKAFTSQRPYVEFIPKAKGQSLEELQMNEQKAKIASLLVDDQLEANDFKLKLYNFVTSYLIYPAAIMGVGWKYEVKMVKRKNRYTMPLLDPFGRIHVDEAGQPVMQTVTEIIEQPEVTYDGNELINIDFYDFWVDPKAQSIEDARYVFHREWLTRAEIEEKIAVLQEAHGGNVFNVDWEKIGPSSGLEEGKWERQSEVGISPATDDQGNDQDYLRQYEVLNYWEDERYALLINRSEVIYDGPNHYWRHSEKPFAVSSYEPLPNEFYGMSAVELVADIQEEINTHRNQRIDNISLVMNKMWKVKRGADIDESELVSRPHGIIHVDDMGDIEEFRMTDVTGSSYAEEQMSKTDMENTLGVPAVVRGADSSRRETATEIVTKTSNAGIRFDVKIMLFESTFFKRIARLMDLNNQQFVDEEKAVRITGPAGMEEWRMIDPVEIVGEFDYRPAGPAIDPAANKEMRRQQLMTLYDIALRSQSPYFNIAYLTRELVDSFDLRNADRIVKSEEEIMQEMMQQQMAQQQMMQQQALQEQMTQEPQGGGQIDPALLQTIMSGG
jgi:hypothetical protein